MLLPPSMMTYLRKLQLEAMTETASIITSGEDIPDGSGGSTSGDVTTGPIPCYRFPEVAGVGEVILAGQLTQGLRWKFGFPAGTLVRDKSRIEMADATYEILAVVAPESYASVVLAYAVKR